MVRFLHSHNRGGVFVSVFAFSVSPALSRRVLVLFPSCFPQRRQAARAEPSHHRTHTHIHTHTLSPSCYFLWDFPFIVYRTHAWASVYVTIATLLSASLSTFPHVSHHPLYSRILHCSFLLVFYLISLTSPPLMFPRPVCVLTHRCNRSIS